MEKQLSPAEKAAARNDLLKLIASRRLAANAEYNKKHKLHYTARKPECAPNRKAGARLKARQADYMTMTAKAASHGWAGFHKPGAA